MSRNRLLSASKSNDFFEILPKEILEIILYYVIPDQKSYLSLLLTNKFFNETLNSIIDRHIEDPRVKLLVIKNRYIDFLIAQLAYIKLMNHCLNLDSKSEALSESKNAINGIYNSRDFLYEGGMEDAHYNMLPLMDEYKKLLFLKLFAKGIMLNNNGKVFDYFWYNMPIQVINIIKQIKDIVEKHAAGYSKSKQLKPFELTFGAKSSDSDEGNLGMESLGLIRYRDGNTIAHLSILLGNINPENTQDKLAALINYCLANGSYLAENYPNIILDNDSFNSFNAFDKKGNTALDLFLQAISRNYFNYEDFKKRNGYSDEIFIPTFEKLYSACKNFKPLNEIAIENMEKNNMGNIAKLYKDKIKGHQSYHSL